MAISLARYWVRIHPDFTVFRNEVRAEAALMARTAEFKVRPSLELTTFRAQWRVFAAAYLKEQTITVRPVMAPGALTRSIFRARDLSIVVKLDLTAFRAQWRLFAATYLNVIHRIRIHPVISATAVSGMIDVFDRAGSSSGTSFGRSFRLKMIAALVVGLLPLLQPLLAIMGSVVQAAGALGAALPLALAGVAVTVTTLVLVFGGLKDAIEGAFSGDPTKKQREAYANLSDSAKKFVKILLETKTQLRGFKKEVQESFFKPFLGGFKDLVASPAIKQLRAEMALIAGVAGKTGGEIAKVFAASAHSGQLKDILVIIREIFTKFASVLPLLTGMFLTLSKAAGPFVKILTDDIVRGLTKFTVLVDEAEKDGRLAKFFDDGYRAIKDILAVIGNIYGAFKEVYDVLTRGNKDALAGLKETTAKFEEFLKSLEGQQALFAFAETLELIGAILKSVIGPLIPLVITLSTEIGGPLKDAIRDILGPAERFLETLKDGWTPIIQALGPLWQEVVRVGKEFLKDVLEKLTEHIEKALPKLQELADKLGPKLIPFVKQLGEVFKELSPLIPVLGAFLLTLLDVIVALTPVFSLFITVSTFLWGVIAVVIGWLVKLVGAFLSVITIVKEVPGWLAALGRWFASFGDEISAVARNIRNAWNTAWEWLRDRVFGPLSNVITNTVPNAFRQGVGFIGEQWDRLKAVARSPVDFFINTVVNRGIVGTFNAVAKWIPGLGTVSEVHPPGFAHGGHFDGRLPGPPSDVDNMLARGPRGLLALAGGEMVVNARQTAKHLPLLQAINSGIEGFAGGGIIDAIMDPTGWVKGKVGNVLGNIPGGGRMVDILKGLGVRMIDGLVGLVKDRLLGGASGFLKGIGPGFGTWPSSPGAQRGDSGVWRTIVALIMGTGPMSGSFGNGFRPGDPLWHGSGRAVDWMGYNQDALATLLSLLRPLELIHRTNKRDYAYTRGRNVGSFSAGLMEAHRNHIHIAMSGGGLLAKVFDGGGPWKSGTLGINTSGHTEHVSSGASMERMCAIMEAVRQDLADLRAAVERVAPGVGRELNGSAATMLQLGRGR